MGPYVHRTLTLQWALRAGLTQADATVVADACAALDLELPARAGAGAMTRHFGPWANLWRRRYLAEALRVGSLPALGRALHAAQDAATHGALGLAHLRHRARLMRREPDDWDVAPERVRRAVERASVRVLERFVRERPRLP